MTVQTIVPDFDQRRLAAGELQKNIVVLAGAGTGKTTLLVERLTLLILGKEIPIDKIVALTFTKKAAEEMRERLEQRLRDVVAGTFFSTLLGEHFSENKSRWTVLAKKALDDIPKAQIGTIHSFAGHLLRLYPLHAGVDPAFREDEGTVAETVFDRMWAEWVRIELGEASSRVAAWSSLLQRVHLTELRELAFSMLSPLVDLSSLRKKADIGPVLEQAQSQLSRLRSRCPEPTRARTFCDALDALTTIFSLLSEGKRVPPELTELTERLETKPPSGWEEAAASLKELKRTADAFSSIDEALFNEIFELLVPFIESVRQELARVGSVSFDGLLVFARNLLRDHSDVRESLKVRFATFLVDEFQDTDPLQGEILFYLSERTGYSAKRWEDVQQEPGRLFVVGDPKQSIYRFRGADIAAFEAFEEHMLRQGAIKATLSANFRSDSRILNFVNAMFPRVMREKKFLQPPYSVLVAGKENAFTSSEPAVKILRIKGGDESKLSAEDRRRVEAQTITDWIEAQVKHETRYSDIAVLLRSANAFGAYLDVFRSRGIPYLAEGEKSFYRTSEVVDFLNLLSVIANPEDRLALVGVLRSPVGGLTDKEIWELKKTNGLSLTAASEPNEKIGHLFQTLLTLSKDAQSLPLSTLIKRVFKQTWALELASTSSSGEQAVANLLKVGRLADAWSEQSPLSLGEFVRRFAKYREDERDEGENPLADVKYDAVKILTIHKAKGLEFPIVLLPNLSAGKRGNGEKKSWRRDWRSGLIGLRLSECHLTNTAMALIEMEEAKREKAEEIRVFYVAATRAKSQVVCFVDGSAENGSSFASIVNAVSDSIDVTVQSIERDPTRIFNFSRPALSLSLDWNAGTLASLFEQREQEFQTIKSERLVVSPTSLLSEPEKGPSLDEEALVSRSRAIQTGLLCHKILEEWDFACPATQHKSLLKKALTKAAKLFELLPDDPNSELIIKDAESIMEGFLSSGVYQRLSTVKVLGREIPFACPTLHGAMRGVIDLLYEQEGRVVVADYKTNKLKEGSEKKLVDHYRLQGEAYQDAVRNALGVDVKFELIFLRNSKTILL